MSDIIAQFATLLPDGYILNIFAFGIIAAVMCALFSWPNERL